MQAEDFVHLHVHSEYSLLDGSIRVKKYVKELVARGARAAALTDHDAMHGALEFYLECQKEKINGIIGYEANIEFLHAQKSRKPGHLVLLAENDEGYRNLVKLCSLANTVGKDRLGTDSISLTWDEMRTYAKGLICLTSSLKGELAALLLAGERALAEAYLDFLVEIFGRDNVFVELINNNLIEQAKLTPQLVALAREKQLACVATADVHYLHKKDQKTHLSILAIKHKLQQSSLKDVDTSYEFHLTTFEEMQQKFADYPEALANTKVIADRCKIHIDTKSIFMPDYRQRPEETSDDCLVRLAREGLEERKKEIMGWMGEKFTDEMWKHYHERLEYEISVILKMKFSGYFLIVQDFINWAKDHDIPVGPGRGSAAGSLVTYALRITNIDPLRFNLLFERFLNPERISMPDIDTDFCQDKRGQVLEYVYGKYGQSAVSQIVTFGRMKAKNALKNLARIKGWSFTESNDFAKLIPEGPDVSLDQAYKDEEKIRQRLEADERAKELWDGALQIEGVLASLGIHAAGVIISDRALDERCPLLESEGQLLTQYEYKLAEKIGLIKFDFLGLKTLTVIDNAVKLIRQRHKPDFDIDRIDLEDPKVYEAISTAHVTGIFQLESSGMRKLIADLKPSCFTDIVAVLALFRPGPLGSGMVEDFVLRKHGKNAVEYLFPELEPILSDTYGVIVYQEQVQKIAAVLANYSLGEADLLRRAMGKKDKAEMERQKARFVSGATENGHNPERVADLFDLMAKFAEYGFNKSHTAAYGYVTYQTAFLKTYYPTEFMTAIMTCDLDNTEKIVNYVRDCRRMKITLLPPCVNSSRFEFSIPRERTIQFGLGAVKGLGKGIVDLIVEEREKNGPFQTVPEFIARVDPRRLNKKVLETLIKAGAFDELATNRAELLANTDAWLRAIAKEAERKEQVGDGIFGAFETVESKPKPRQISAPTAQNTSKTKRALSNFCPLLRPTETIPENSSVAQMLVGIRLQPTKPHPLKLQIEGEFSTLGFYMTAHPSDIFRDDLDAMAQIPLDEVPLHLEPDTVPEFKRKAIKVAGLLTMVLEKRTKDGDKFCVLKLEDGTGELEISLFPKQYAALDRVFQVGEAVWVECKIRKGIEEGTVRASCQAIGKLEEKRLDSAKCVVLAASEEFFEATENTDKLFAILGRHAGKIPLLVDVFIPRENVKMRAHLSNHSVLPTDAFISEIEETWPGEMKVNRLYRPPQWGAL